MGIRKHVRLLSALLVGLAGAGLLTVGFGLTPLTGSIFRLGSQGDFSMSSNSPVTVPQSSTGTVTITVASTNHFSGDLSVTASLTTGANTPPIVKTSLSSVSLSSDAIGSFTVTVTATSSTTLGYYNITVQGKTSTLSHSMTISADVTPPPPPPTPDFYLSSNPSSLTTPRGTSTTATLTISSILSYSGNVALSATIYPSGINSPRVSLNLTTLILRAGATNATTLIANAFNSTAGSYTIQITGTSGTHTNTIYISLSVTAPVGREILYLEFYIFFSPTNATLYIRNGGTLTSTLTAYYVTDTSGDQYALTSWNGPVINPNQLGPAKILIGASCSGCTRTGSAFTFTPGNSYTVSVITSYGGQFMFTITEPIQESLSLDHATLNSGTNVTLYLRNNGNVPTTLVSYNVTNASGNRYVLTSFAGPTIPVGALVPVNVTIGPSCPSCRLYGSAFTFTIGNSYTFTFLTSRNNLFTYLISW